MWRVKKGIGIVGYFRQPYSPVHSAVISLNVKKGESCSIFSLLGLQRTPLEANGSLTYDRSNPNHRHMFEQRRIDVLTRSPSGDATYFRLVWQLYSNTQTRVLAKPCKIAEKEDANTRHICYVLAQNKCFSPRLNYF